MPPKRKRQDLMVDGGEEESPPKLRKSARNKNLKQEVFDANDNIETGLGNKLEKKKGKAARKTKIKEKIDMEDEEAFEKAGVKRDTENKKMNSSKQKKNVDAPKMKTKASKTKDNKIKQEKRDAEDDETISNGKGAKKIKKEILDEEESSKVKGDLQKKGKPKASKKKNKPEETIIVKEEPDKEIALESNACNKKSKKKSVAPRKEAKQRSLVKKGKAPVDGLCPIASTSHVFSDQDGIWDCMLNQTNIQFNNNKYYIIQLLEGDTKKCYSVWMRWGRVGADGQNSLKPCGGDLQQAMNVFTKKFYDKTRNQWLHRSSFEKVPGKYDMLEMDYSEGKEEDAVDSAPKEKKDPVKVECTLEKNVKDLIELICDVKAMEQAVIEMKYDAKKAPLGKLTEAQVKAGYEALKTIDNIIAGSGKTSNRDLLQACNDFYTRIPHYFGMKVPPLIRTKNEVKEKIQLLEALADIQAAMNVIGQLCDDDTHPADQQYQGLGCNIEVLAKKSDTFKILEKYLKTTHAKTHNMYDLEVLNIFSISKGMEEDRFDDVGNRMLLWHGSRLTNWAGILSQGLRIAPPEAPVTGYMFGKGIYFADMCSKSANYCMATNTNNVGILVLCDVALGNMRELQQADYKADKLPKGYHSVKGVGETCPSPDNSEELDGAVVPMGPCKKSQSHKGALLYNEYIVYNTSQVKIKYLFKVKFNFKF